MRDAVRDATQAMIDKADAVVRQAHGGEADGPADANQQARAYV